MAVEKLSCRAIATCKEFRNLGRWSWIFLWGKNNIRTTIVTAYWLTVSFISGGEYIQQLEAFTIMKIQNYPRNKFWIYLNEDISKWIHQWEKIILMGDWKSGVSEVNTWMESQGLTNKIWNLHGYSDSTIKYQQSKDFPINGIYWSASLMANRRGFLSFGGLVGYHQSLCIKINENRLLVFRQHDIIPPMAHNVCLADTRTIKKFNDKIHRRVVKHEIYQKIHYIHVQYSYPLQTHLSQDFEKWDELITRFIYAADKNAEGK